jgi:aconitase A
MDTDFVNTPTDEAHGTSGTGSFCVGFEVLTAGVMNSSVFWGITQCNLLGGNRNFEGRYHFHVRGVKST